MAVNDYPNVINGGPVDADFWYNPVARDLTALKATVNGQARGIIKRADRSSNSSTTTTEIGVLRLDGIVVSTGRALIVSTNPMYLFSSVANDIVEIRLRYTTDGSNATTSSPIMPKATAQDRVYNTSGGPTQMIETEYTPAGIPSETLSILLTVTRISGTGTVAVFASAIKVSDVGIDPGASGVSI